jgi:hypothetical protein
MRSKRISKQDSDAKARVRGEGKFGEGTVEAGRRPETQKAAISGRLSGLLRYEAVLDTLDVFCLPALGAFDHVKLNLLTFLQAAEAAGLNGGEMHEYVLAVLAADESIAFGVVKPLHCSCFHVDTMFLFVDVALKLSRILLQAGHALG